MSLLNPAEAFIMTYSLIAQQLKSTTIKLSILRTALSLHFHAEVKNKNLNQAVSPYHYPDDGSNKTSDSYCISALLFYDHTKAKDVNYEFVIERD